MEPRESQAKRRSAAKIEEITYACDISNPFCLEAFQERYRFASSFVSEKDVAADVGCGPGYGTRILAGKATRVYGLDFNANAIALAKQQYALPNIEYHCADIFQFDFPKEHFDLVTCFEVLDT